MANKGLWSKGHKIKQFDIIPSGGGEPVNLAGQLAGIKYYEDIIDASVHVQIVINDTYGFMGAIPIRSGMTVNLEIEHPSVPEQGFVWNENSIPLVITNISDNIADQKREVYVLTLETKHAVSNHTLRVWEKYGGKISNTVEKILTKKMNIPKDRIDIDETRNNCDFTGNYRRPLFMISSLCPKAITPNSGFLRTTKGSAGYLFYEDQDGYHFKSIDNIMDFAGAGKLQPWQMYTASTGKSALENNNMTFSGIPKWTENHDILKKMRSGAYKTANYYYNILTREPVFSEYSIRESLKDLKKANEEVLIPENVSESYSRITFGTLDNGTMTPNWRGKKRETPQDQAVYQSQASARYSALFSQMCEVTVPMNLNLRVGQVIVLGISRINTESETKKGQNPASGRYMIARLAHDFGSANGDFTGLSLIRDSFLPYEGR